MTLTKPDVYRQSLLRSFTVCGRRTLHGMKVGDDMAIGWVGRRGDLGTAFHEFAHRYLATLHETGHGQMPTQEAIEVMYEVLAELPFTLPFGELDELRWLVLGFCDLLWNPKRILALEERLEAEILCPDGEVRVLKGQPDVLLADPPDWIICGDYKSGLGRPKGPRVEPEVGEVVEERKYLSDLFQGDSYSFLAMRKYPTARGVIFRELHLRSGQIRQGRLTREQLEHVERKLAVTMMNLDRAISEGEESSLWAPRPGAHCARQCPVARSCPVPEEMRGDGAIETDERADEVARLYAVAKAQYTQAADQLKAWEEGGNRAGRANESEAVRWGPDAEAFRTKGGGRKFGLWPVVKVESEETA